MTNNSVFDPQNPIHIYAKEVVEKVKSDNKEAAEDENFGSIIIILTIISITISVIRFIWDCRHARDIPGLCKNPGIFERVTLQREVRKGMDRDLFKKYGKDIIEAMLSTGASREPATVQKMYDLAKS